MPIKDRCCVHRVEGTHGSSRCVVERRCSIAPSAFPPCPRVQQLLAHRVDESGSLHDTVETDVWHFLICLQVARKVFVRPRINPAPATDEIGNRFRLELADLDRQSSPVRPPSPVRRFHMAAVEMCQLVDEGCVLRFARVLAVQQQLMPYRDFYVRWFNSPLKNSRDDRP